MKVFVYMRSNAASSPPVNIQIPNEPKMCEKSHCGKSFLCIFSLVRGEDLTQKKDGDEDEKSEA